MDNPFKKILTSILRQRKMLIQKQFSGKNTQVCLAYIKEISIQMEAHGNKWNEEGWRKFIQRNLDKIEYLVPENKAGQTIKNKLYELK